MSISGKVPFATAEKVRDQCLCLQVQRAARALARRFDDALRPFGLTNGQFSLLMALNRVSPPSIGSVAALLAMDRTTLTAALKPLARRRLLKINADHKDRRSRLLTLTSAGHKALASALPVWQSMHATLETLLAGAGVESLRRKLHALS
jgi:DNA-binding MarR family transcriptional regulator